MSTAADQALLKSETLDGLGNALGAGQRPPDAGPGFSSEAKDGEAETMTQSGGSCGPLAGIVEAFSLFCIVPGFWRLALYMFLSAAGGLLPAIFYLGPLSSQIWGKKATSYSLVINACQFAVAIPGAPIFGMWSDGRSRKTSVLIMAFAGLLRVIPFIFLDGAPALWSSSVVTVLTSPFVSQLSGSPVLWAWMTDVIPQEHRETGFALIFSIGALAAWTIGNICSALINAFGWPAKYFMYIGIGFLFLSVLLVTITPFAPPPERADDPDPLARQTSLKDYLISPFRLVARKRSLRYICGAAAFVTLPDVAVTYVAQPIVFVIMGIDGDGKPPNNPDGPALQAQVAQWFSNFPNIFLIIIYTGVGILSKRFGPAKALLYWTPITCCMFAAPALFALIKDGSNPPLEVFGGVMMCSPLSMYPPLQALVALLVPPSRVGEAMGAVAACKNVASLCAPLLMQLVITFISYDLYWVLFPGAALFMLSGAWPFVIMLNKRMGEGTDTDVKWSVWSSVGGGSHHGSRTGSRIGTTGSAQR